MKNNNVMYKTYCLTCKQAVYHPEVVAGTPSLVKIIDSGPWQIFSHIPSNHYILKDAVLMYEIATCASYDVMKSIIDKVEDRVDMHPKKRDGHVV